MFTIGELAEISKVTVRTLRYYDAIDLLKPAEVHAGGRRLYNEANLTTLEYILMLKEVGFELNGIKNILRKNEQNPKDLLEMRLQLVNEQLKKYNDAKHQLETAIQLFDVGDYESLEELFRHLKPHSGRERDAVQARRKYFTPEEQTKIEKLPKVGEDSPIAWKWSELLRDIKQAIEMGMPESSQEASALVKRWNDLTLEIYEGDWKTAQKAWRIHQSTNEDIGFVQFNQEAVKYVEKAAGHYYAKQGTIGNE